MFRTLLVCTVMVVPAASCRGADIASLIHTIKAVDPKAAGHAAVADAWTQLTRVPAADLPVLLAAIDDASPAAANWLRSAVEAVAERERSAGHQLPTSSLESFLRNRRHTGHARRLAYELLSSVDAAAPARLLPTMLDDPGAELRFEAVAVAFDAAKGLPPDSAAARDEVRKLLAASRDGRQIDAIARELDRRGEHVDLVKHLGFITRWQIAGPFDNADNKGFRTAFAPESGVDLTAKYVGKGGTEVAWRPAAANKDGTVNLNEYFPADATPRSGKSKGLKAAVAYAVAVVELPVDRPVEVRAASATAIKVFVNEREVLARETYHQSFDRDAFVAAARLAKGRNAILVKTCQNDQSEDWAQNWMFQLRLTDDLGAAVPLTVIEPGNAGGPR